MLYGIYRLGEKTHQHYQDLDYKNCQILSTIADDENQRIYFFKDNSKYNNIYETFNSSLDAY